MNLQQLYAGMPSKMKTQFQIPSGWRMLQDGESIQDGDRYFAEKAIRTEKDYAQGSTILDRWDNSFSIGHKIDDLKIHSAYIRKI